MAHLTDTIKTRLDGWYNALTGLGTALRDKQTQTYFVQGARLTDNELEVLFHENDLAAKICESLPEEALRKGYFLTTNDDAETVELNSKLETYGEALEWAEALEEAAVWGQTYGGCVIYLGIEDGQLEDKPVNMEAIKSINFAHVIDRRYISPHTWYDDPTEDVKFGKPETYSIGQFPVAGGAAPLRDGAIIHESRVLRFDGSRTGVRRRARNDGWSESVLEKVDEVLAQFGSAWQGVSHLMNDAAQGVFKIKNLVEIMGGGDCNTLQSRMEVVDMSRSVARAILLDADMESFERVDYGFTGIPEVLQIFIIRLASAARMPVTVLMGQSPAGMNATGESDIRLWYDRVQAYQRQKLKPAIGRFWELVFAAQDFEAEAPDEWGVSFERLWQMTDKEQADLEKTVAEKDKIYIDAGVLLPEEVALSRYTPRGFSQETQIDMDAREEMLKKEIDLAKEKAGEDPMEAMLEQGQPPGSPPGTQPPADDGEDEDE